MTYSIKDSYDAYQGASNGNSTAAEMKEDTTEVAGSTPEEEQNVEYDPDSDLKKELAELSDEELVDKWEWAAQHDWKSTQETAAELMAERNISPKYGEYAEMSQDEITHHKQFRKRWLDE